MSIEDLQTDFAQNQREIDALSALSSVGDVVAHLKNTFWPFVGNVVTEVAEMDQALRDMYEQSEDVLQFDTGKQLAGTIGGAVTLVDELERRAAGDAQLLAAIAEWRKVAKESLDVLEEITLPELEDEGDPDDDEGDDDDEDDDVDEGKAAQ